jgi:hypothetical protein
VPSLGLQLLQALLDHLEIGDGELEVEILHVAPRVGGRRDRRVIEGTRDVEQRIGIANEGQQVRVDRALARRAGGDGDIHVRDVGVGRLLRIEQRREPVDPLVGNLDDADVGRRAPAGESAGLGMAAGERIEDGRLAAARQAHDGDLHLVAGLQVDEVAQRLTGAVAAEVVDEQLDRALDDAVRGP